jgi:hypothetical protein
MPLLALSNVMFLFLSDTFIQLDITGPGGGGGNGGGGGGQNALEKGKDKNVKIQILCEEQVLFLAILFWKRKFLNYRVRQLFLDCCTRTKKTQRS